MSYPLADNVGSDITRAIGQMDFTGNVVAMSWFKHLKHPGGKPHLAAVMILADLVYWYRPSEIRNEATGQVKGWEKKFAGDLLQKTYAAYSELMGITKREVRSAFDTLEREGIVWREFRTVRTERSTLGNVMFVGLNVNRLREITTPPLTFKRHTYDVQTQEVSPSNVIPMTFEGDTLTKNTTETGAKIPQRAAAALEAGAETSDDPVDDHRVAAAANDELVSFLEDEAGIHNKRTLKRALAAIRECSYTLPELRAILAELERREQRGGVDNLPGLFVAKLESGDRPTQRDLAKNYNGDASADWRALLKNGNV